MEYLNIEQGLLLGAYKAGLSFGELIDLIATREVRGEERSDIGNPRAIKGHALLAENYTIETPHHITPHGIPPAVIKRYMLGSSSNTLLCLAAACLYWDKPHHEDYWTWLLESVGISRDKAKRAADNAKRMGMIRQVRSRPDIGRCYANKYKRLGGGG